MLEIPYLIRRPIIRIGGRTMFGFNQRLVESLFG
jgi:arsenate reductase-like glutaredoxin family protein